MNALQALIAAHVAATGESYADIARRGGMSRQTVSSLALRDTSRQTPRPETLRKLAAGLGLDLQTVRAAAANAAGFQTIHVEDQDALIIVAALAELDDEQRDALKRRAMSLLAEAREAHRTMNHDGVDPAAVARAAAREARRRSRPVKTERRRVTRRGAAG